MIFNLLILLGSANYWDGCIYNSLVEGTYNSCLEYPNIVDIQNNTDFNEILSTIPGGTEYVYITYKVNASKDKSLDLSKIVINLTDIRITFDGLSICIKNTPKNAMINNIRFEGGILNFVSTDPKNKYFEANNMEASCQQVVGLFNVTYLVLSIRQSFNVSEIKGSFSRYLILRFPFNENKTNEFILNKDGWTVEGGKIIFGRNGVSSKAVGISNVDMPRSAILRLNFSIFPANISTTFNVSILCFTSLNFSVSESLNSKTFLYPLRLTCLLQQKSDLVSIGRVDYHENYFNRSEVNGPYKGNYTLFNYVYGCFEDSCHPDDGLGDGDGVDGEIVPDELPKPDIVESSSKKFIFSGSTIDTDGDNKQELNETSKLFVIKASSNEIELSGNQKTPIEVYIEPTQDNTKIKISGNNFGSAVFGIRANNQNIELKIDSSKVPINILSDSATQSSLLIQTTNTTAESLTLNKITLSQSNLILSLPKAVKTLYLDEISSFKNSKLDTSSSESVSNSIHLFEENQIIETFTNQVEVKTGSRVTLTNFHIKEKFIISPNSYITFKGVKSSLDKDLYIQAIIDSNYNITRDGSLINFPEIIDFTPKSVLIKNKDNNNKVEKVCLICTKKTFPTCNVWKELLKSNESPYSLGTCSNTCLYVSVDSNPPKKNPLSVGAIVGIVIGSVAVLIIIGLIIFFVRKKNHKSNSSTG